MATVQYDAKTGKKLSAGQTTTDAKGNTYTQGQTFSAPSTSSSKSYGDGYGNTFSSQAAASASYNAKSTPSSSSSSGGGGGGSSSVVIPQSVKDFNAQMVAATPSSGGGSSTVVIPQEVKDFNAQMVASSAPVSSNNLKVGSTGQAVIDLQKKLGITADGIFGAQTDAAVKAYQAANGLTTDGVVGVNTAAKMNSTLATAPMAKDPAITDPNVPAPVLPTPTAEVVQNSYMESLNMQIAQMQKTIDIQRQDYIQQIQQEKQNAIDEIRSIRDSQAEGIAEQGNVAVESKEAKLEEINKEIARFDEAYKVKQGLTTQLQDLITQGNALILSQKATTGLTAIRNPRVNETISNLSSAASVLKIGIDAQDGNMTNVQNQLSTAVAAITSAYKDQLDYYSTLNNFYESSVTDAGNKLIKLTAAEQDFLTTNIAVLQDRIDKVQANADAMQNLFIDPSTATAFAKAGITLTTPQSEWGTKLAKQAYADELSEQSKDMASKGYTALVVGNAPAGSEVVRITDSNGAIKTYWKKGSSGSKEVTSSIEQSIREDIDVFLYQEGLSKDIAYSRLRNLYTTDEISDSDLKGMVGIEQQTKTTPSTTTTTKPKKLGINPATGKTEEIIKSPIAGGAVTYKPITDGLKIQDNWTIPTEAAIGDFLNSLGGI